MRGRCEMMTGCSRALRRLRGRRGSRAPIPSCTLPCMSEDRGRAQRRRARALMRQVIVRCQKTGGLMRYAKLQICRWTGPSAALFERGIIRARRAGKEPRRRRRGNEETRGPRTQRLWGGHCAVDPMEREARRAGVAQTAQARKRRTGLPQRAGPKSVSDCVERGRLQGWARVRGRLRGRWAGQRRGPGATWAGGGKDQRTRSEGARLGKPRRRCRRGA